ncbi:MAG: hypothetical protein WCB47_03650 [Pseudolabrys sp.]
MADADVSARIDRLERLAHWEDLETRIARLERLATVAGIAIAIGVGAAVGTYVQGSVHFHPWGWAAVLASLAAIGLTILLQVKLSRLDA